MSITIKHEGFNFKNGVKVTGYKIYRSDVSREDCETKTEVLGEFEEDSNTFVDNNVIENKLYWYRVDADTEFGVARGKVRACQWVRDYGIATGEFLFGDNECGMLRVDAAKAADFRATLEFRYTRILREANLMFSNSSTASSPFVYGALSINGECIMLPTTLTPLTSGLSYSGTEHLNMERILAADRLFAFDGNYYEVDVLSAEEIQTMNKYPSVHVASEPFSGSWPLAVRTQVNYAAKRPAVTEGFGSTASTTYCLYPIGGYPMQQRASAVSNRGATDSSLIVRLVR